jgi:hypothetical protein
MARGFPVMRDGTLARREVRLREALAGFAEGPEGQLPRVRAIVDIAQPHDLEGRETFPVAEVGVPQFDPEGRGFAHDDDRCLVAVTHGLVVEYRLPAGHFDRHAKVDAEFTGAHRVRTGIERLLPSTWRGLGNGEIAGKDPDGSRWRSFAGTRREDAKPHGAGDSKRLPPTHFNLDSKDRPRAKARSLRRSHQCLQAPTPRRNYRQIL